MCAADQHSSQQNLCFSASFSSSPPEGACGGHCDDKCRFSRHRSPAHVRRAPLEADAGRGDHCGKEGGKHVLRDLPGPTSTVSLPRCFRVCFRWSFFLGCVLFQLWVVSVGATDDAIDAVAAAFVSYCAVYLIHSLEVPSPLRSSCAVPGYFSRAR